MIFNLVIILGNFLINIKLKIIWVLELELELTYFPKISTTNTDQQVSPLQLTKMPTADCFRVVALSV